MPYQILKAKQPVKVWVGDLAEVESQALDQLRDTAALPWVKGVAGMPDVHFGKGATVGSVLLNDGAVSPSVVGVDIGCFTGDTEVATVSGNRRLSDCVGDDLFIFAFDLTEKLVVPARAVALKTRVYAALVEIHLDEGGFRCTPDHPIMLREGTYKRADELISGDRLMPLRFGLDEDGYQYVNQPHFREHRERWPLTFTHRMVAQAFLGRTSEIVHHKDENKLNNSPFNLQLMAPGEHSSLHARDHTHWQNEEFERKRVAALAQKATSLEGYSFYAERGGANFKKYMQDRPQHFAEAIAQNGQRGKKSLIAVNGDPKHQAKLKLPKRFNCVFCGQKIKSEDFKGFHYQRYHKTEIQQYYLKQNHTVKTVSHLAEREDVYCLEVPGYNNFALACGVFVHNCGMAAVKTPFRLNDKLEKGEKLKALRHSVERSTPVGFNSNKKVDARVVKAFEDLGPQSERALALKSNRALEQLGSLGGGNHFIEVSLDEHSNVWVMLHSGSRNIGKELAEIHIHKAKGLMGETLKQYGQIVIPADLAPLLVGTKEYQDYLYDLHWAQAYAKANRDEMMQRVLKDLSHHMVGYDMGYTSMCLERVDCHHNYIEPMVIDGHHYLLTRKGAVSAKRGEKGIIPSSMGRTSYIVEGLGNADSFCSCSHGAGRTMSRGKAKRTFTLADLAAQTEGVECRKDGGVLDEIPGAYKDIDRVMMNQEDLVRPVAALKPLLCVKG